MNKTTTPVTVVETPEAFIGTRQRVIVLGYKRSGKRTLLKTLSKRQLLPDDELLSSSVELACCDKNMTLFSINPERNSLSPILRASTGAVVLVSASDINAEKHLFSLLEYCQKNRISNIGVGLWVRSNEKYYFNENEIHQRLTDRQLMLPLVTIEDANADDINSLLEAVCTKGVNFSV